MQAVLSFKNNYLTLVLSVFLSCVVYQEARAENPMTAGVILKQMPSSEFVVYTAGIIEGLAYARFRADTKRAGEKSEKGMQCIREWYHNDKEAITKIEAAFRKYDKYPPWVVLASLVKKKCGE